MTMISAVLRAAVCAAVLSGTLVSAAAAEGSVHVFKPARGISLDVGATKVVGYYLATNGVCGVTLMMGAKADADGNVVPGATRVEMPVAAGRKSQVSTNEGRKLEFSCGTGAKLLTVTTPNAVVSLR